MLNQHIQTKKCSNPKCQQIKPLTEFYKDNRHKDGLQSHCKSCFNNRSNQWRLNHPIGRHQIQKHFRNQHKEEIKIKRELNKEKTNQKFNQRRKIRRQQDPNYKLLCNLRSRFAYARKSQSALKFHRTLKLINLTIDELWQHLAGRFTPVMTLENYGKVWQIDHIIPCSFYNQNDSVEQQQCWHWTNLQPMEKYENKHIKKDRIDHSTQLCKNLPLCVSE